MDTKRILDAVHGYISVPKSYCTNIIDTPYFQRLRRIEQTPIRSVFPCARHDRFIHSLGVFHIGHKIVESIKWRYADGFAEDDLIVYDSYELACLLHDVSHAPFSHTFEEFYVPNNRLDDTLCNLLKRYDAKFETDLKNQLSRSAPHEIMSAIMVIKVYGEWIVNNTRADLALVARMIIGCKYSVNNSFRNAFIDLIHGDIIDADGIDYVCRDSWASGYSTNAIDVDRLIESICIEKDDNEEYKVCYTTKAQNEIEAVLGVKNFQQVNVFTHHKIVYDQSLLVKAMESAALYHIYGKINDNDEDLRRQALYELCDIDAFYQVVELPFSRVKLIYPDDDFISLMKYIPQDKYVKQWLSRKYLLKPLWKSSADFYSCFPILVDKKFTKGCWLFSDQARMYIADQLKCDIDSIWIEHATPKYKLYLASEINLFINGKIIPYRALFSRDKNTFKPEQNPLVYIYVPEEYDRDNIITILNNQLQNFVF